MFGKLDGLVDGGVVGDAVVPENLIEAQPLDILQQWFLWAVLGFARDEPVQSGLPAHEAIDQFLAEPAVGGRELRAGQSVLEQVLDEGTAGTALEDLDSNFSWFLAAHNLK